MLTRAALPAALALLLTSVAHAQQPQAEAPQSMETKLTQATAALATMEDRYDRVSMEYAYSFGEAAQLRLRVRTLIRERDELKRQLDAVKKSQPATVPTPPVEPPK